MVVCSYWEGLRLGAISSGKGVIFIRGIYKGLGKGSLGGGRRRWIGTVGEEIWEVVGQ